MNRPLGSDEIREIFLRFFTERHHARIGSASIIPANDPTLLFINAGMAPLKPYFLGEALPPAPDLCNVQPCVRTVDIGDVGDRHHLTFFEMLGSWSIDHYFKDRAVELAFELLTQEFGFAIEKLYMTVFGGDEKLGIPPDDLAAAAWERVGVPRDHIVYLGADDNFWSAGDTGPCGPCTEVFYDTGPAHGPQHVLNDLIEIDLRCFAAVLLEHGANAPDHLAGTVAVPDDPLQGVAGFIEVRRGTSKEAQACIGVRDHGR